MRNSLGREAAHLRHVGSVAVYPLSHKHRATIGAHHLAYIAIAALAGIHNVQGGYFINVEVNHRFSTVTTSWFHVNVALASLCPMG